ncbi:Ser/Thr protein kinase RdoA (MazF antagonist) [Dysgonomonas sp. PFB1-18]|uniref:phosphotransferase enzyme family protein n=1 Tax=unclassified Dysgonomonas TaxID=2630389 RepID=UPI0024746411|nr:MULTISPECIES: aminoglycoside phosphotransferase family protein [unclassified Dysgonomonas]MDH6310448.1 Ser/Thr protein kinase RdoA (MazF antagonist) [Dysgonomonas sp. PF1-14]MDH6340759.1 Ser/Thr protein kinase RdoA (MazF antagonist) [Dysgonomonas sp. PF1-16]MDH6382379.1 Ser/Thr protein kinase RdoA (MazF antagonist) [Dysgonomonas sp. PFB1-18]MDH6399720.1 Ser/Thr protein kinase RdoA (MazF antagonist) [Dysgonomonas sp. PF1-23]
MISLPVNIEKHFAIEGTVKKIRPLGEGLINDTFFIETEGDSPNYILQRKNKNIFKYIPAMMENIHKVTTHLKKKIIEKGGDPLREALTVTLTVDGKLYYEDEHGDYWAACLFIDDTITYEYADSPQLASQGGKGIGKFQAMLADMKEPLADILPGFHNMRFRFQQWDDVLEKDPVGRKVKVQKEIEWIESRRDEMIALWAKAESGEIPTRVTHNDTKISNILFDKQGNVLCVIDLDTVLSSIVLNDYGDAIRSYTNAGKEDDENLDNVYIKMDIFEGYTTGYLSETVSFLTQSEIDNLAFSAKYITFEQVLRFLMDYIDGDNYYKVKNEEHNLVRTHAQYKLLQSMEENYDQMCAIVSRVVKDMK